MVQKIGRKIKVRLVLSAIIFTLFLFRILTRIILDDIVYFKMEYFMSMAINTGLLLVLVISLVSSMFLISKRRQNENENNSR